MTPLGPAWGDSRLGPTASSPGDPLCGEDDVPIGVPQLPETLPPDVAVAGDKNGTGIETHQ